MKHNITIYKKEPEWKYRLGMVSNEFCAGTVGGGGGGVQLALLDPNTCPQLS